MSRTFNHAPTVPAGATSHAPSVPAGPCEPAHYYLLISMRGTFPDLLELAARGGR